ncbi:MAG: corrinoid protein [candidate division Zixibacteria bacterium]
MEVLEVLSETLQKGQAETTSTLTKQAISEGIPAKTILDSALISGMTAIGVEFKAHRIFLPQVLMAAKAMQRGMDELKPLLLRDDIPPVGKIVIGTVQGDLHDIGKNLVGIMLRGAGLEVIDLGKDVPPEKFVEAAVEQSASVIGLSALLTTTMPVMKKVVDIAAERGLSGSISVIVGGAPLTKEFATDIGAADYCYDGISAVDCVKRLMGLN